METLTRTTTTDKPKVSEHTRQLLKLLRGRCYCWLLMPMGLGPVRVTKREMRSYVRHYGDQLHYQLSTDGTRLTLEPLPW